MEALFFALLGQVYFDIAHGPRVIPFGDIIFNYKLQLF